MTIFKLEEFSSTLNANDRRSMGCSKVYVELSKLIAEEEEHFLYPQNLFNSNEPTSLILITKKNLIIGKEDNGGIEIQIKRKTEISEFTYLKKSSGKEGDVLSVSFKNGQQLILDAKKDTIGEEEWETVYSENMNFILKELAKL